MKTEIPLADKPTPSREQLAPIWSKLIATFFGIGTLRPGPGTWGSAVAVLIWAGISHVVSLPSQTIVLIFLTLVAVAVGIPAATRFARAAGQKDPQSVVIDEVAGQWITLILAPVTWKALLVGFILFRGFDILKTPPVRQLERLPEGIGIVVDDIAAGVYAFLVMRLLMHFGLFTK